MTDNKPAPKTTKKPHKRGDRRRKAKRGYKILMALIAIVILIFIVVWLLNGADFTAALQAIIDFGRTVSETVGSAIVDFFNFITGGFIGEEVQ